MDHDGFLAQQVSGSIAQLHSLLDEIGVPGHEREAREAAVFAALSEALEGQVRLVAADKKKLVDEAKRLVAAIRQTEATLDGPRRHSHDRDDDLVVSYPLTRCLQQLRDKHAHVARLHRERFEHVRKLVDALESYSSHLEPAFVQVALPPPGPSPPPGWDLSPSYVDGLDAEFSRIYDEYARRLASVQALADHVVQLWAELGVPQAQQDADILRHHRDAPEQLGLHLDDVERLRVRRDRLADEKRAREKWLRDLRAAVEALWAKLGVNEADARALLARTRGCGLRQINELEDELARLGELKHQNLHVFVEDARLRLQRLWDALYLSEDEMLDFSPAFSDVYSDALLEAHESEVERLEAVREQRGPTLALIDRHRTLVRDRDELAAASQDASRLMMRGQRGDKRDPGKLLREEKMRKHIAKELPRVTANVRRALAAWEDDYGRPFLVFGERYLDALDADDDAASARSKTPAGPPPPPPPSTARTRPGRGGDAHGSPSRIPPRAPLSSLKHGANSPARLRPESRAAVLRKGAPPPPRAPPPKMRDLGAVPELEVPYRAGGGGGVVRQVEPEDVYDDRARAVSGLSGGGGGAGLGLASRLASNELTAVSRSENWETYDDTSEPEPDAYDAYYAKLRATHGKRLGPPDPAPASQPKRPRGAPAGLDADGARVASAGEWTDDGL